MASMFGYMDLLIVVKWLTDWSANTGRSPSIVGMMVGMFLKAGEVDPNEDAILGDQALIQKFLLLIIVITPPWMLLAKPVILYNRHTELVR